MGQPPFIYVIGLGSNLGDRFGQMQAAIDQLDSLGQVETVSRVFQTPPLGPPQPDYLNAAARLSTTLAPLDLLTALQGVERSLGRTREVRWGPRTVDLDILWWSGGLYKGPALLIPHPELCSRDFALAPLVEVMPRAWEPNSGALYAEILRRSGFPPLEPIQRALQVGAKDGVAPT